MVRLKMLLPLFQMLALLIFTIDAKRNFEIIFESIKCDANPTYFEKPICFVTRNSTKSLGNIEVKFKREITSMHFSFNIVIMRHKNEQLTLFNSTNMDFCEFLKGSKISFNILGIVRDVLLKFGSLPKGCPLPKDLKFLFKDIFFDAERLPPYTPEGKFFASFNSTHGKDYAFSVETTGYNVQKSTSIRWG